MHRALRFATGAVILATAFLLSCHDQQNSPTAVQTTPASASAKAKKPFSIPKGWIEDTTRKGLKKVIVPDLPSCDTYDQFYWVPDSYFRPVSGYTLGVWNTAGYSASELHDRYGFTGIVVDALDLETYNEVIVEGFSQSEIMLCLPLAATNGVWTTYTDWHLTVHPGTVWYYVDEPFENPGGYNRTQSETWDGMEQVIQRIGLSRSLTAGSNHTGRQEYYQFGENHANFFMMYTAYDQESLDSDWDDFYNYYGSHNRTNWLNTSSDNEVMGAMFIKAAARGWNTMWCYMPSGGPIRFCESACGVGWMQERYHYFQVHWLCDSPNPCTTCEFGVSGNWYVEYTHDFNETTEWF